MKASKVVCGALAAALFSGSAAAGVDMRCGTRLVQRGMTPDEVRQLCDQPTVIEQNGTVWVYQGEAGQFAKVITFVEGQVEFVDERQPDAASGDAAERSP